MKKTKLITSLSTLAILTTAVPAVVTSCAETSGGGLSDIRYAGYAVRNVPLEEKNYLVFSADLFSAKSGNENVAISKINLVSSDSSVVKIEQVTKNYEYKVEAQSGKKGKTADILATVWDDKGRSGTASATITVSEYIPDISFPSAIVEGTNCTWFPWKQYNNDIQGFLSISDVATLAKGLQITPPSGITPNKYEFYEMDLDTLKISITSKISYSSPADGISIAEDFLESTDAGKAVYISGLDSSNKKVCEGYFGVYNWDSLIDWPEINEGANVEIDESTEVVTYTIPASKSEGVFTAKSDKEIKTSTSGLAVQFKAFYWNNDDYVEDKEIAFSYDGSTSTLTTSISPNHSKISTPRETYIVCMNNAERYVAPLVISLVVK